MPISYAPIGSYTSTASVLNSGHIPVTQNVAVGAYIAVWVGVNPNGKTFTYTDSQGNSSTPQTPSSQSTSPATTCGWIVVGPLTTALTTAGSDWFQVAQSSPADALACGGLAVTGSSGPGQTATASGVSKTCATGAVTTASGDLVLLVGASSSSQTEITPASGFTQIALTFPQTTSGSSVRSVFVVKGSGTGSPVTPSVTLPNSLAWSAAALTFTIIPTQEGYGYLCNVGGTGSLPVGTNKFGADTTLTGWYPELDYTFNTNTATPPAGGEVRVDNTSPASVANIYASTTDRWGNAQTLSGWSAGHVIDVVQQIDNGQQATYTINTVSTHTGYVQLAVTYQSGSSTGAWVNGASYGLFDTSVQTSLATAYSIMTQSPQASYSGGYFHTGMGPYSKFFDGGAGWHTAYENYIGSGWGANANELHPMILAKGTYNSAAFSTLLTNMATAIPGQVYYVCWDQEPNLNSPSLISSYQAAYNDMASVRAGAGSAGTNVKIWPVLNAYGQYYNGFPNPTTFLTGLTIDGVGWDCYKVSSFGSSWTFSSTYYTLISSVQASLGVPWSIPEAGLQLASGQSVGDLIATWTAWLNTCVNDPNFAWMNYWMDGYDSPNQRARWLYDNPSAMSVLQEIVG